MGHGKRFGMFNPFVTLYYQKDKMKKRSEKQPFYYLRHRFFFLKKKIVLNELKTDKRELAKFC